MSNPCFYIKTVLFQRIQFSISIAFCLHTVRCQINSISNNSMQHKYTGSVSKTVLFQTILFSVSTLFQCQETFLFQYISLSYVHRLVLNDT